MNLPNQARGLLLGLVSFAALLAAAVAIALGSYTLAIGGGGAVVVGAFLAYRRAGGSVAWLLFGFGISSVLAEIVAALAADVSAVPIERAIGILASTVFPLVGLFGNALLLTFPTGRALRGWRWVFGAVIAIGALGCAAGFVWALGRPAAVLLEVANATSDAEGGLPVNPAELFSAALFAVFPLSLASLLHRHRLAPLAEQLQIRWLLLAFGTLFTVTVGQNIAGDFTSPIALTSTVVAFLLIPTAIGIAIVRHRLYDIDRIISRTVTYALVAVVVGGIYALPVVLVPSRIGAGNDLVVAGATLAAAAAFNPIRRQIQAIVDRRFNRARFDGEVVLAQISERLSHQTALDELRGDVWSAVTRTMSPVAASLWIREPT